MTTGICPQRDSNVLDELLADGSMVLFHPPTRQLLTLNPTGALVWDCCDGSHTEAEIVAEIAALFPGVTSLADDVVAIVRDFRGHGILQ
jgi:hypothetical protein